MPFCSGALLVSSLWLGLKSYMFSGTVTMPIYWVYDLRGYNELERQCGDLQRNCAEKFLGQRAFSSSGHRGVLVYWLL